MEFLLNARKFIVHRFLVEIVFASLWTFIGNNIENFNMNIDDKSIGMYGRGSLLYLFLFFLISLQEYLRFYVQTKMLLYHLSFNQIVFPSPFPPTASQISKKNHILTGFTKRNHKYDSYKSLFNFPPSNYQRTDLSHNSSRNSSIFTTFCSQLASKSSKYKNCQDWIVYSTQ